MSEEQKLPDAGEGYRLLEVGETISEGDDSYSYLLGGTWKPACLIGNVVRPLYYGNYRRRLPDTPVLP